MCSKFLERRITRRKFCKNVGFPSENRIIQIIATIRRGMGKDIDAACGQLRKAYMESSETK